MQFTEESLKNLIAGRPAGKVRDGPKDCVAQGKRTVRKGRSPFPALPIIPRRVVGRCVRKLSVSVGSLPFFKYGYPLAFLLSSIVPGKVRTIPHISQLPGTPVCNLWVSPLVYPCTGRKGLYTQTVTAAPARADVTVSLVNSIAAVRVNSAPAYRRPPACQTEVCNNWAAFP